MDDKGEFIKNLRVEGADPFQMLQAIKVAREISGLAEDDGPGGESCTISAKITRDGKPYVPWRMITTEDFKKSLSDTVPSEEEE